MTRKLKNPMSKKCLYRIIIGAVAVLLLAGIFLPGMFVLWQSNRQMNVVSVAPQEYYSPANLAVARNASANMEVYQKLQLITGRWEGVTSLADIYEGGMEDYQAVEMAKKYVERLYLQGMYPENLMTNYENWYSWNAEVYKVVDATFHTYTVCYWKLTFTKYDGTQTHDIYMLNNGFVFLAENRNENGIAEEQLSKPIGKEIPKGKQGLQEYLAFVGIDAGGLQWMDFYEVEYAGEHPGDYHVLKALSDNHYVYSFQPELLSKIKTEK